MTTQAGDEPKQARGVDRRWLILVREARLFVRLRQVADLFNIADGIEEGEIGAQRSAD